MVFLRVPCERVRISETLTSPPKSPSRPSGLSKAPSHSIDSVACRKSTHVSESPTATARPLKTAHVCGEVGERVGLQLESKRGLSRQPRG